MTMKIQRRGWLTASERLLSSEGRIVVLRCVCVTAPSPLLLRSDVTSASDAVQCDDGVEPGTLRTGFDKCSQCSPFVWGGASDRSSWYQFGDDVMTMCGEG